MPQQRRRPHPPCRPLLCHRICRRKQHRLRHRRLAQRRRVVLEQHRPQILPPLARHRRRAAIDRRPIDRLRRIQRPPHPGALRALPRDRQHHARLPLFPGVDRHRAGRQRRRGVRPRPAHHRPPPGHRLPARLQRVGRIGQRRRLLAREPPRQLRPGRLARRRRLPRPHHHRPPVRGGGRLAHRRFFDDHVRVGAAHAERAHARPSRSPAARPRLRLARHVERTLLPIDLRIRRPVVQARRQHLRLQALHHFDQPGHPRRRIQMAEVGLHRPDPAVAPPPCLFPIGLRQRADLDRIAEQRAGAVALDVVDVVGRQPRRPQRLLDHDDLTSDRRRREARLHGSIVVDRRSLDHGVHVVAVGERRVEPLQHHHAHAAAEHRAARGGVEHATAAVGRQHAAVLDEVAGHVRDVDRRAAGERHATFVALQTLRCQMDGDERGRARALDRAARASQVERVRHTRGEKREVVAEAQMKRPDRRHDLVVPHELQEIGVRPRAGEDTDAVRERGRVVPRVLETRPAHFEEQPMLRIHQLRLARRDPEERRVEAFDVVQHRRGANVMTVGEMVGRHAGRPQLVVVEAADAVAAVDEVLPELVRRIGARESAGVADDGDVGRRTGWIGHQGPSTVTAAARRRRTRARVRTVLR